MNSTGDKIKGTINATVGKVKEAAGKAINNEKLENEGTTQKIEGKGQQILGVLKDKIQEGAHTLGDNIKKVGDTIKHITD